MRGTGSAGKKSRDGVTLRDGIVGKPVVQFREWPGARERQHFGLGDMEFDIMKAVLDGIKGHPSFLYED